LDKKITMSEINLMKKFNIKPYKHYVQVRKIYMNGKMYGDEILKINDNYLQEKVLKGITNVTGFALRCNIPCKASAVHTIKTAFLNLCGLAKSTDCMFKQAEALCSGGGPGPSTAVKEEKKEEKKDAKKDDKKKKMIKNHKQKNHLKKKKHPPKKKKWALEDSSKLIIIKIETII